MNSLIAMLCLNCLSMAAQPAEVLVYVGTYTNRGSEGVYVYRLDPANGGLKAVTKSPRLNNPSFVAIDPKGRGLYAVREGGPVGAIIALARDPKTGALTLLNEQPSGGQGPCFVTVDPEGRYAFAANYGSGSVAMFPIAADGRLQPASSVIQHQGSSVNPSRQKGPHAHSINLDPTNRFAFAPDLGLDKIMIYRVDWEHGTLVPHDPPFAKVEPGSGPRHFAFHPDGKHAYVIQEIASMITAFSYEAGTGTLKPLQTVSTLPKDFKGTNTAADIHVHPSGKFLYGSNRGHDSIAVFAIDAQTGALRVVGYTPTQGRNPRNFAIDPSGTFLLAANQDGNNIVSFRINPQTGALTPTGQVCQVSMPVCIKMVEP